MRDVPESMTTAWLSGDFTGARKPMFRVTVQRPRMELHTTTFPTPVVPVAAVSGVPMLTAARPARFTQTYADLLFHNVERPVELPNAKTLTWTRSVDTDIATGSLSLINGAAQPLGTPVGGRLDDTGVFTYNRGKAWFSPRWGHAPNAWARLLMPDNILRTFEGYGYDPGSAPEDDPNLVQTGTWMIDDVTFGADGLIEVTFRDLGRILTDQMVMHPVIPDAFYPLHFDKWPAIPSVGKARLPLVFDTSSAFPYWGGGSGNRLIYGHRAQDAFDDSDATFWLSVGNSSPTHTYSYEWVQGKLKGQTLGSVTFRTWGAGYTVYVSVHDGTRWVQHATRDVIGYVRGGLADQNTDIPFCERATVPAEKDVTVTFRQPIKNARLVRLTFHNLVHTTFGAGAGSPLLPHEWGRYRAGVRTIRAYSGVPTPAHPAPVPGAGANPGFYADYCADEDTEIFTRRGWLRWNEVEVGDETLAIDPASGTSSWQAITGVFREHRQDRDMVLMDSSTHSSLTTPDHRWLVRDQAGQWLWRMTGTLATGHRIPLAVPRADLPTEPKFSDALVELVAWTYTEGWLRGPRQGLSIGQSSIHNPEKVERIRTALHAEFGSPVARLGRSGKAEWGESERADGLITFGLSTVAAREIVALAPAKVPSMDFLTNLTEEQLRLFIDVSVMADGWRRGEQRFFGQNVGPRLDAFLAACALVGQPTSTRVWVPGHASVTLLRRAAHLPVNAVNTGSGARVEHVVYTGHIWCPTLPTRHNWLARRRGTVYFTGNTDVVKLLCAWGGFHQPMSGGFLRTRDNAMDTMMPNLSDPVLGPGSVGRAYGWFDQTGTLGDKAPLGVELFDKKSLLDAIAYVRNICGFLFCIDELGSVVWRRPNVYEAGNTIWSLQAGNVFPERTSDVVLVDERTTLLGLRAQLTSRNVRERVFVASSTGEAAAVVAGFNPNPIGLRRVAGWTDEQFTNARDCTVMADLIALRELFTYRTDQLGIPGYPRVQVDDQIRVYEEVTSEGYLHYVKAITSTNDLETGVFTYDMSVAWLGEDPSGVWAIKTGDLSAETREYLAALVREPVI